MLIITGLALFSMMVLIFGAGSSTFNSIYGYTIDDSTIIKKDLKTIMNDYKTAIQKAKNDFLLSVKKANEDARNAIKKGIPIDEINSATKSSILKARDDLKLDIQNAKDEAKSALLSLKEAVERNNQSSI